MPTGHDELKEQQGWVTRALNAEARVEELEDALEHLMALADVPLASSKAYGRAHRVLALK